MVVVVVVMVVMVVQQQDRVGGRAGSGQQHRQCQ